MNTKLPPESTPEALIWGGGENRQREPFGWAQFQKSWRSASSCSQCGIHQAWQCQHPSLPPHSWACACHSVSSPRRMEPSWDGCRTRLSGWLAWLLGESCSCFTPGKGTGKHKPRISIGAGHEATALGCASPEAALSQHLCHSQLSGMGFPRVVNTQMPLSKARSFALALPTPRPELTVKTMCWVIAGLTHNGKQSSYPSSPSLIPHPFPPAVKKSFQICRLNTFFVHFRPFTLYPTSLGSNNIFPSFDHSISWRVFIGREVSLTELLLSHTAQI